MSDEVLDIITDHSDQMVNDFTEGFTDLADMEFPVWLSQYSLGSPNEVEAELRDEFAELKNDVSAAVIHGARRQLMWLND